MARFQSTTEICDVWCELDVPALQQRRFRIGEEVDRMYGNARPEDLARLTRDVRDGDW